MAKLWTRDEMILALDLYRKAGHLPGTDPEVVRLSGCISKSRDSVNMRLANFVSLDPNHPGKGLPNGGDLCKRIWDEFVDDHARLRTTAAAIKRLLGCR